MEQVVRVSRLLPDQMAEVIRVRESACSGECHKCSGCGAAKQTVMLIARNAIDAKVGDMVVITSGSALVLKAAAVLYLVPLLLFLVGYLVGENLWGRGVLLGLAGILLGIILVKLYDKFLAKTGIEFTITSYAEENTSA